MNHREESPVVERVSYWVTQQQDALVASCGVTAIAGLIDADTFAVVFIAFTAGLLLRDVRAGP